MSPTYNRTSQVGPCGGVAPDPHASVVPAPQGGVVPGSDNVRGSGLYSGESVVPVPVEYDYIRLNQQVGVAGGGATGKTQDQDGVYESINTN